MSNFSSIKCDPDMLVAAAELVARALHHDRDAIEAQNYTDFLRIMAELEWPAFLDYDTEFHAIICDLFDNGLYADIYNAVLEHYDAFYVKDLEDQIENSSIINKQRIPIITEALKLYILGFYYGCITTILSQMVGIVKDIEKFLEDNGLTFSTENKSLVESLYHSSSKKDKGKIITAILESKPYLNYRGACLYLIHYIKNKIFYTELDDYDSNLHVNRHMIFHGEQLNFGSKEQALKAILCIDSLLLVSEAIYNQVA